MRNRQNPNFQSGLKIVGWSQARSYLKRLRTISITVKQVSHSYYFDTAGDNAAVDLWDRILVRLDQEISPEGERDEYSSLSLQHKRRYYLRFSKYLH